MGRIELTGLRADVPLGAMAAFGCLRVCERIPEFRGSRLAWQGRGGADTAVLCTPGDSGPDALVAALTGDVKNAGRRMELTWRDQIKTAMQDDFRKAAARALEAATTDDHEAADWFAAFGTELELDLEGKIETTPFDMSVARQRFLADALRLAGGLAEDRARGKTAIESYREALFGPWRYEDDQHSLGWDPSTMKLGAFTHKAPTAMANAGVRVAVWLAFESLPLFPCFSAHGLTVRAFQRDGKEFVFCWPVWRGEVGLEVLQSLLAWAASEASASDTECAGRGVHAVYKSARFKPNKYLASFRPPELVFGGASVAVV